MKQFLSGLMIGLVFGISLLINTQTLPQSEAQEWFINPNPGGNPEILLPFSNNNGVTADENGVITLPDTSFNLLLKPC